VVTGIRKEQEYNEAKEFGALNTKFHKISYKQFILQTKYT
jgi:hypothetical protein